MIAEDVVVRDRIVSLHVAVRSGQFNLCLSYKCACYIQQKDELHVEVCSMDECRFYCLHQHGLVPIEKLTFVIFTVWMCFKVRKKKKYWSKGE